MLELSGVWVEYNFQDVLTKLREFDQLELEEKG